MVWGFNFITPANTTFLLGRASSFSLKNGIYFEVFHLPPSPSHEPTGAHMINFHLLVKYGACSCYTHTRPSLCAPPTYIHMVQIWHRNPIKMIKCGTQKTRRELHYTSVEHRPQYEILTSSMPLSRRVGNLKTQQSVKLSNFFGGVPIENKEHSNAVDDIVGLRTEVNFPVFWTQECTQCDQIDL